MAVMFVGSSNNGVPCMVDFRGIDIHAPFPSTMHGTPLFEEPTNITALRLAVA